MHWKQEGLSLRLEEYASLLKVEVLHPMQRTSMDARILPSKNHVDNNAPIIVRHWMQLSNTPEDGSSTRYVKLAIHLHGRPDLAHEEPRG